MTRHLRTAAWLLVSMALGTSAAAADLRLVRSTSGSRGSQQGGRYVIEDPRSVFSPAGGERSASSPRSAGRAQAK